MGSAAKSDAPYAKARSSAVMVVTKIKNNNQALYFGGSGVIYSKTRDLIISSLHIVLNRIPGEKISCVSMLDTNGKIFTANDEIAPYLPGNECEVVAQDLESDLVLLKRKVPFNEEKSAIALADADPKVGDAVHGVFAPNLIPSTWYESYINNYIDKPTRIDGLNPKFALSKAFGFAAPVAQGASGAMVLDKEGKLVGITFAVIYNVGTGLAVPASQLKKFLAEKWEKKKAPVSE